MSIVAMESQCMKKIIIHVAVKSDLMLSDQKTLQIIPLILVELAKSVDCDFSSTKLALQNVSVCRKHISCQEISTIFC